MSEAELVCIPVVDVREGGAVRHAVDARARARALRDDCVTWLPRGARMLLPAMDALTRRWLQRSHSPYVMDLEAIAVALGFPGIWFLNGTYQWGCTAVARDEDGVPWLARTLDWPFPGLGRHIEFARMRGPAGEFVNVTWPGYAGALTALAPGRFAAAINQAPLWRRTRKPWLRPYDLAANALRTWPIRFRPPDHLLREVFETCRDFGAAKRRLETVPVARPVIFTLIGCERGERCVIERTEEGFASRTEDTSTANDWLRSTTPWEARVCATLLLKSSPEEATAHSRARREALSSWPQPFARSDFAWVTPPVLNPFTRIAVEMCAASGTLRAVGYEPEPGGTLPRRATQVRELVVQDHRHGHEPAQTGDDGTAVLADARRLGALRGDDGDAHDRLGAGRPQDDAAAAEKLLLDGFALGHHRLAICRPRARRDAHVARELRIALEVLAQRAERKAAPLHHLEQSSLPLTAKVRL